MAEFKKGKRTKSISPNKDECNLFLRISDGNSYSKEIQVILKAVLRMGTTRQEELFVFQSPSVLFEDNCKTIESFRSIFRWISLNLILCLEIHN